jgi:CheY-like chemotaxis protein
MKDDVKGELVGQDKKGAPPKGLCVLIVDDDPDFAEMLGEVLTRRGHTVTLAHGALEAIEAALRGRPDVILVDIGLPQIDGYQLAALVKARPELARTPLVAVTGYGSNAEQARSLAAGFTHHLVKPDLSKLPQYLEKIAAERA